MQTQDLHGSHELQTPRASSEIRKCIQTIGLTHISQRSRHFRSSKTSIAQCNGITGGVYPSNILPLRAHNTYCLQSVRKSSFPILTCIFNMTTFRKQPMHFNDRRQLPTYARGMESYHFHALEIPSVCSLRKYEKL